MCESLVFKSLRYEKSDIGPNTHEFICVNMQDEGETHFAGSYSKGSVQELGYRVLSEFNKNSEHYELVLFYNNLFGYKRKNMESPFPYRFLIASEFNGDGLAMVGFNGGVSFIDESFNILTKEGWKFFGPRTLLTMSNDGLFPIEIEQILGDESVIARIFFGDTSYCLSLDHEILGLQKEIFVPYQKGDIPISGYSIKEKGVVFEDGRFYSWADLGRIAIEQYPNFLSIINARQEKLHTLLPKK